ncbi:MAG: GtrA family protein [Eubacterium sp.]|nr:GtrA family protein [Eubacterium sp.]
MKEKDCFDRLFHKKPFNIFESFYQKNREVLLYLFFGGLTFIVSVVSYALFYKVCGMNALIANVFSWILAVLFAYITNRIWVFQSQHNSRLKVLIEILSFFGGRVFTLVVEEVILWVGISHLHGDGVLVKVVAQIVVIVLNYVISKLFVFRNEKK